MADLDFGTTDGQAIHTLKGFADRVNSDLYNHDRDGLVTRFNTFTTAQAATEVERERQHKANTARLNIIIAILTLIAAYIGVVLTLHGVQHSGVDPHNLFHSQNPQTLVSSEAKIPQL